MICHLFIYTQNTGQSCIPHAGKQAIKSELHFQSIQRKNPVPSLQASLQSHSLKTHELSDYCWRTSPQERWGEDEMKENFNKYNKSTSKIL